MLITTPVNLWVDNMKEVNWNDQAFQQLVLHPPTKKMIKALIEIRASPGGIEKIMKRQDIISGKGQGLIMLLHGGPGTGKTLTAGKFRACTDPCFILTPKFRKVCYIHDIYIDK